MCDNLIEDVCNEHHYENSGTENLSFGQYYYV